MLEQLERDETSKVKDTSNKDVVAIISGGIDSTAMLWYLQNNGYNVVEALSFDYGQKHSREINSAKQVVEQFNKDFSKQIKHYVVDIKSIGELISRGALTGEDKVPHEMYDSENQRVTIVPNRNMILLSIAVGRAVTIEARYVAYAAHASDYSVYPDCRPEFIEALDKAVYLGNLWTPVNILAPFKYLTKTEVVALGNENHAPFNLTWSCYEGKERPCLSCGTCLERTEAFLENGLKDPALTPEEWENAVRIYEEHSRKELE